MSIDQIYLLAKTLVDDLEVLMTGYLAEVDWHNLPKLVDVASLLDVDQATLIAELQVDAYAYFILQIVQLYPPVQGSFVPNITQTALLQTQQQLYTLIADLVMNQCTQRCEELLNV